MLDTELTLKGMLKEYESLESFGTFVWILDDEVKKQGYPVNSSRSVLSTRR